MMTAASPTELMIAGIMNCSRFRSGSSKKGLYPKGGAHPQYRDGMMSTSVAIQKEGKANPRIETNLTE